MKSKQLANVLIKILGLSICLQGIPSCISMVLASLTHLVASSKLDAGLIRIMTSLIGAAIQVAVGLTIINKSRKVADFLFKNGDDLDA